MDGTTNLDPSIPAQRDFLALAEGGQLSSAGIQSLYGGSVSPPAGAAEHSETGFIQVSAVSRLRTPSVHRALFGRRELADAAWQMRALYDRRGCATDGLCQPELCDVACGRLEGYVELVLQPWDYAAGMLILAEAGDRLLPGGGARGAPLSLAEGGPLLASNGRLRGALQTILKE